MNENTIRVRIQEKTSRIAYMKECDLNRSEKIISSDASLKICRVKYVHENGLGLCSH